MIGYDRHASPTPRVVAEGTFVSSDPDRRWDTLTTREASSLASRDPVIVLPLAAVEQHGPHLPLATDAEVGHGILADAFRRLPANLHAWILPMQTVGTSHEHRNFAGTLSLPPELLADVVYQLGASVAATGIRRLVLFNSHGGNTAVLDTAGLRLRTDHQLLVVKASHFNFSRPADVGLPDTEWEHGLHGGAVETAMMLHLRPDLVHTEALDRFRSLGEELDSTLRQIRPEGGASFAWLAEDLHIEGVTGDTRLASAEMGARLVAHYGQVLAEIIEDTQAFPLDRLR